MKEVRWIRGGEETSLAWLEGAVWSGDSGIGVEDPSTLWWSLQLTQKAPLARENQTVWFALPECSLLLLLGAETSPTGPPCRMGGSLQSTTELNKT